MNLPLRDGAFSETSARRHDPEFGFGVLGSPSGPMLDLARIKTRRSLAPRSSRRIFVAIMTTRGIAANAIEPINRSWGSRPPVPGTAAPVVRQRSATGLEMVTSFGVAIGLLRRHHCDRIEWGRTQVVRLGHLRKDLSRKRLKSTTIKARKRI